MTTFLTYFGQPARLTYIFFLFLLSCQPGEKASTTTEESPEAVKWQFNDYPDLKLGFTTQNFLPVLDVTTENARKLISYAAEEGYSWIELRDPDATLSREEAEKIAEFARQNDIEVSYAIQKGLLDPDFWPTFQRGVENAAVFEGPRLFRSLGSFAEFNGNPEKLGWSEEELMRLVNIADSAAGIAEEQNLQYVIENAAEAFFGEETAYYGIAELFEKTSPEVGWQFDTANPFSVSRVHPPADEVGQYLRAYADNLFYIHLKSADNGQAQTTLQANPLPFAEVFQVMQEYEVPYVAIELQAVDNEQQAFENMSKSLQYLEQEGFISKP
jgi:sugar phosphate isomerase/epimerase